MQESSPAKGDLRVLADGKLNVSQLSAQGARKANHVLRYIEHSTTDRPREVIVPVCTALLQPHIKYCVQFSAPQYKANT